MSKGVSPLVASVLLIAATMSIAGILAFWASTFTKTSVESFNNQTITTACNYATFAVYTCAYDANNTRILISLNNNGQVDLKNLVAYVQYSDSSINPINISDTLPQNSLKQFYLNNVSSNFTKIQIRTQCPQLSEETVCR
jgi:flagellin-like protein